MVGSLSSWEYARQMFVACRFVALASLLIASAASAAEPEPSERDRNIARESVYQGDDFTKRGDFKRALEAYRRANDIMQVPTTAIEVVRASLKLGLLVEALAACEQTAAFPQQSGERAPFTAARNEALKLMTELHARIPQLSIAVRTPTDVEPQVVVDGKALRPYAQSTQNPGHHIVDASAPGLVSAHDEFDLIEGQTKRVELVLTPAVTAAAATKSGGTYWPLAFSGLGLALAGVATGSVTGMLSLNAANELSQVCRPDASCPPNLGLESTNDRRNTFATVATIAFAAAGVGAVVGLPSLIVSVRAKKDAPREGLAIGPLFDSAGKPVLGASITVW